MFPVPRQRQVIPPTPRRNQLRRLWNRGRVILTASGIALSVIGIRFTGILQPLELATLDQGFRWRATKPPDDRIVIVGITETDIRSLNQWPLSDAKLAELLRKIQQGNPQAIGLDLYRDLQSQSGSAEINQLFAKSPNIFGILLLQPDANNQSVERLEDAIAVRPPAILAQKNQIGFNNTIQDVDQRVRRSLLYWPVQIRTTDPNGEPQIRTQHYESFALKIAQHYLKPYEITPQAAPGYRNPRVMQLGKAILPSLKQSDGLYTRADTGGYQIFANYRGPTSHFKHVSALDVLTGKLPADTFRDRIVLIGSVAGSLKDTVATPYSTLKQDSPQLMSGVELQANLISQLITAALNDGQGIFQTLPEGVEWVWVWVAAYWGTYISWRLRSPQKSFVVICLSSLGLIIITYGAFISGWIVPLLPPLIALLGASMMVTNYIAHAEQEMNRSKEFLAQIIDSIPDPIFVKDRHQDWIVLNQAYANFIGLPIDQLLGQNVHSIFPAAQAQWLRTQDEWVFGRQATQEVEEEFVNLQGQRYHISTKRSLHRDRAGNVFLVGVIHDITERKTLEEELKQARDKLSRDNSELSYLANHDALTGLPNRKLFLECLQQAIETAAAASHPHHKVALLFLDLDGFKEVNDTLGHNVGDLLLQAVAQRLQSCLRAGSDTVARLGGDEFVVVLPNVPGALVAKRVAQKILTTLAEEFTIESHGIQVTTSIGISLYPQDGEQITGLIQAADTAMYQSKNSGKNQYTIAQITRTAVKRPAR
ncbi:CHASE2 domain-containing protein [filamentous cyanobacterium LEGE 11480]|uniref:CHASE2 domain-containing protein n=1 Tax=Romeriopsis navalis LEGE 11480 TaxID=2777977 RepID=A0A928VNG6_9CYAN|nr:CHASE2 domain-containing protein [Romeriopsis navalis]MBE9030908.1 CHASE2 domain-containing protein [Romeriopsis navalis LEGE 11480]